MTNDIRSLSDLEIDTVAGGFGPPLAVAAAGVATGLAMGTFAVGAGVTLAVVGKVIEEMEEGEGATVAPGTDNNGNFVDENGNPVDARGNPIGE